MKKFLLLIFILSAVSCGGGGGSSEPAISPLTGVWEGDLYLVQDQCDIKVNLLQERHGISIDGEEITLVSTDGRTLEGNVTSPNSFSVQIVTDFSFPVVDEVIYSDIIQGTANVRVKHSYSRPGGCTTVWEGPMHLAFIHLTPQ